MQTSRINMLKTIQISATFSTIMLRLDSFGSWLYQCWPPQQLAIHGFYKMPGEKGDPIACFSCGKEWCCKDSTKVITDQELLHMHNVDCLWADMRREIMTSSSVITNHSAEARPPQQQVETDSSRYPHKSSPLSSPLLSTNGTSVEMASDVSCPTSADNLHTRSDNMSPS
jgi:Inhibitor of Apoptosis domain